MGRHDKLLVIGALNFLSLSILYFKNDPESVFISILIPLYQIFYVAAQLTSSLLCCFILLELWYPNFRIKYISTTDNFYKYTTSALLFTAICIFSTWLFRLTHLAKSDFLLLALCVLNAAVSSTCTHQNQHFITSITKKVNKKIVKSLKVGKNVAVVKAVQKVDPVVDKSSKYVVDDKSRKYVVDDGKVDVKDFEGLKEDLVEADHEDLLKKYTIENNIDGLPSKRRRTALELLQTEATYLKNLTIVIQVFKDPLEKSANTSTPLLKQPDIDSMFGGLPLIKKVHDEIYSDLKTLVDDWQEDCSIGKLMCKYEEPLIKAYPPYVNYFDIGKELIMKRRKENVEFDEFLKESSKHPNCMHQPLDALMIRPVQRLPSMSLLMKDLRKRTPPEIKDYEDLGKADEALKNVLMHVNEDKRRFEQKMKIFDIVYQVDNCPCELISSDRMFISKVEVMTHNDVMYRHNERLELFLMSDKLEVAKWRRRPSTRSPFLLKHIQLIDLSHIEQLYEIESEDFKSLFAIKYKVYSENEKGVSKIAILESLENCFYKKKWLKEFAQQINKDNDDILLEITPLHFAEFLKKGSKLYRRMKSSKDK